MRLAPDHEFVLSATDLVRFLSCRHLTALDMGVALGKRELPPIREDRLLTMLTQRGRDHEARYVEYLRSTDQAVFDAQGANNDLTSDEKRDIARDAMRRGEDYIIQAALGDGCWFGIADVLQRIATPSSLGGWSYEVADTKLALDTRAGTILQLSLYSELLTSIQGRTPELFHVITPDPEKVDSPEGDPYAFLPWSYRVNDYAAYFRLSRTQMVKAMSSGDDALGASNYPDPVEYCLLCRWWSACDSRWREDDHTSLIAGVSRRQRRELAENGISTLTGVAQLPDALPFKPRRSSRKTYERVREQACVQFESRNTQSPIYRLRAHEQGRGLDRLPEPSPGDVFLDLEGDPFARESRGYANGGREYLFGVVTIGASGEAEYTAFWALDDQEEKAAFEQMIDLIMARWKGNDGMHVYHYAPYEHVAFRRLAGRYATREDELDRLLRGGRFVDLYAVVRESMFVGVERYSIKQLESLFGFEREEDLREAGRARARIAWALGSGLRHAITDKVRETIARYNQDDCVSALRLRDWLETVRSSALESGVPVARPAVQPDEASQALDEKARRVEELRTLLLKDVPNDAAHRSPEQEARWVLAYLIDWHRREARSQWREYFELCGMAEEDLLDARRAVSGLEFVGRLGYKPGKNGKPTKTVIDRYRYPEQEIELDAGDELHTQEGVRFGDVEDTNRLARTIDVAKGPSRAEDHPGALFEHSYVRPAAMEDALLDIAGRAAADGRLVVEDGSKDRAARDLLLRNPPRVLRGEFSGSQTTVPALQRLAVELDGTTLAVQGPPGSGKTYQGARMICALVAAGKRVGVTANSHKVIRNILEAVLDAAEETGVKVVAGHKDGNDASDTVSHILSLRSNSESLDALTTGAVQVLGGTTYMWSRGEFAGSVDVLVVDEAGQMSLANVVAASSALVSANGENGQSGSLILLGDPRQLEQPTQGSHPDGVGVSALDHLLGDLQTIPAHLGVFLETTWRLSPALCAFTSDVFYEGKLHSRPGLEAQRLVGAEGLSGSGLFVAPVEHDGNRNASDEEVEAVAQLVVRLTAQGVCWVNDRGESAQMRGEDVLVVSPYNAQVNRLTDRLEGTRARVGTVDKFQGQEAPVVIYSMATSRPEDAPRGMEFLFSLNRLNVATSRARCRAVLVASPALFEVECRSPRQIQLANGICRLLELAAFS